jgi:hypothetical protein
MAVLHATPRIPTLEPIPCKCGRKSQFVVVPHWDNPGDCAPIIDFYTYKVRCNSCGILMPGLIADETIKNWNDFMSKFEEP